MGDPFQRLDIDYSSYRVIETCETKAWYELVHKRVPAGRDSALAFGNAIHAALDVRRRAAMGKIQNADEVAKWMDDAIEDHFMNADGTPIELPADEHRTLGRAKEVIGEYCAWHPDVEFEIVESERAHERELGVVEWWDEQATVPALVQSKPGRWRSTLVNWQGRIDAVLKGRDAPRLYVHDTKTMREGNLEREMAKYTMSAQMKMYCWLRSTEAQPINDAVLDLVIVREPVARVTARTKKRNEFHRLVLHYEQRTINECKADVLYRIGQWLAACRRAAGHPPMNMSACVWPRLCPFLAVCEQPDMASRMAWLAGSAYRPNTWNPMRTNANGGDE